MVILKILRFWRDDHADRRSGAAADIGIVPGAESVCEQAQWNVRTDPVHTQQHRQRTKQLRHRFHHQKDLRRAGDPRPAIFRLPPLRGLRAGDSVKYAQPIDISPYSCHNISVKI